MSKLAHFHLRKQLYVIRLRQNSGLFIFGTLLPSSLKVYIKYGRNSAERM